jgi:hypothetical protein
MRAGAFYGQLQSKRKGDFMNNNVLRILALVAIGSITMTAQLSRGLVAKVPFDFAAGYKSFPAGEYSVSPGPAQGIVAVRSLDNKTTGFVMSQRAESPKAPAKSSLVFNRYGDRYFLSRARVAGETSSALLVKSPTEMEAARKAAAAEESVMASESRGR